MCVCVCVCVKTLFWSLYFGVTVNLIPIFRNGNGSGSRRVFLCPNPPPLPEPAPLGPTGPIPLCHFRANLKAPKLNPKMNKNNYSISFIFFYMANKIILNKFLTHLNNVMSAFKFKKIDKNYFLILKEKRKENLNQKKIIFHQK